MSLNLQRIMSFCYKSLCVVKVPLFGGSRRIPGTSDKLQYTTDLLVTILLCYNIAAADGRKTCTDYVWNKFNINYLVNLVSTIDVFLQQTMCRYQHVLLIP